MQRLDLLDLGGVGDDSPGTRNAGAQVRNKAAVPAHALTGAISDGAEGGSAATNATRRGRFERVFTTLLMQLRSSRQGSMAIRALLFLQLSSDKGACRHVRELHGLHV